MTELIVEFKQESEKLTKELIEILEDIEGDISKKNKLDHYGQLVDRIMGGAKSLSMAVEKSDKLDMIGNYAALCKAVGYKGSQIEDNENFYNIVVALLLDGTEMLDDMVAEIDSEEDKGVEGYITETFLDRLQWVSNQFKGEIRESLAMEGGKNDIQNSQEDIDALLKQLGV